MSQTSTMSSASKKLRPKQRSPSRASRTRSSIRSDDTMRRASSLRSAM
ncbi:hypothetical protein ABH975_003428 [Bradyrhizobium ottawaense]